MAQLSNGGELSPGGRAALIKELFEQCSHGEQVEIISTLSLCLKRDFLVSFPLELIECILYYLDPKYVLATCMLVRNI